MLVRLELDFTETEIKEYFNSNHTYLSSGFWDNDGNPNISQDRIDSMFSACINYDLEKLLKGYFLDKKSFNRDVTMQKILDHD